jgi:oxygen-dependent protoporphyrinogen oxidase
MSVTIIGGGIAGLAAAYEFHTRGIDFVLCEASSRAGGVVFSEEIDGYTIDAGPDALLVQKPEGVKLCEELGLGSRLISTKPPRLAYIQRGQRLHPLPASSVLGIPTRIAPFVRMRLFSWPGKMRMAAEVFVPRRRSQDDESIGAFMTRRFGTEATTYLAEPLLAGIHAGDVDRLSVASLFPRFVETERRHGSLIRAFRNQPRGEVSTSGPFRSLPGGMSELIRAIVAALPASSLHLRTPVERIVPIRDAGPAGKRWRVETTAGDALESNAIVLAAPAYAASRIVGTLDQPLAHLCGEIPYTSTATVVLAFPRANVQHPLNGSGFVVPRVEQSGILAASWMSSKWDHRAPEGRVLLRAFVGGARDPHALEQSDGELVAISLRALRPLLGISGEPLLSRVYRWERSGAQHEVGHLARMSAIESALLRHPGLFVTGSAYRGIGIPDCIADGRRTAAQAADSLTTCPS